jgi:hypothetical protein
MKTLLSTESCLNVWPGGRGVIYSSGSVWAGATLVTIWCDTADGTFIPIGTGVSLTADGSTLFEMPSGVLKSSVSGGNGTTAVSYGIGMTRDLDL